MAEPATTASSSNATVETDTRPVASPSRSSKPARPPAAAQSRETTPTGLTANQDRASSGARARATLHQPDRLETRCRTSRIAPPGHQPLTPPRYRSGQRTSSPRSSAGASTTRSTGPRSGRRVWHARHAGPGLHRPRRPGPVTRATRCRHRPGPGRGALRENGAGSRAARWTDRVASARRAPPPEPRRPALARRLSMFGRSLPCTPHLVPRRRSAWRSPT